MQVSVVPLILPAVHPAKVNLGHVVTVPAVFKTNPELHLVHVSVVPSWVPSAQSVIVVAGHV